MNKLQNGEYLGMLGKGTSGGQLRADGSEIEAGVHLRWQMAQELGFPPEGFDLYRREENHRRYLRCGDFREHDILGVAWEPYTGYDAGAWFTATFSGESRIVQGCGLDSTSAAAFPGEQEVRLDFSEPARYVRIVFDERTAANPVAEAYWQSSSGEVLMGGERAQLRDHYRLITLFADRIDHVILRGRNMVICEVCFVLVKDGFKLGWPQIPLNGGNPIYLPITHPDWNSPHPHTPDDQAEAEARLPGVLPVEKQAGYAQGFQDELHPILYDLVGAEPQNLFRLKHGDLDSSATLDWPGMSLLQLMAVDPNIARILGLYWHDEPPSPNTFYDYRIIAHYGDTPVPGVKFDFSELVPGTRYGSLLEHEGLTYDSVNPIDVVRVNWDESEHNALLFTRTVLAGPIAIALPNMVQSITLRMVADAAVSSRVYRGYKQQFSEIKPAGEMTLHYEDRDGLNKILLFTFGELSLVEVVLRQTIGGIGDLFYDVYHLRSSTQRELFVPSLEPPQVSTSSTGLDENGVLARNQSRVDLRWERREAGGAYLRAGAPALFHVQREDLDGDGETVLQTSILNEHAPTLLSERAGRGEAGQPHYSDRSVADGLYRYSVRGIDLFGVLGDWSLAVEVEVQDHLPPPPPQAVQAQYLDAADPWLSQEDRDWAAANGTGLKLSWQWPGIFSLQAPDVSPPVAEFRLYATRGALNRIDGTVSGVSPNGVTSELVTDLNWPGAADALAGESIRINQDFFLIVAHSPGANCTITVENLSAPDRLPAPGPCSITFSPAHRYWRDYGTAANWQMRLHVEPAQATPTLTATVTAVGDYNESAHEGDLNTFMARAGATRTLTLSKGLQDPLGALIPGVLLCDGLVYPAYGHSLGSALQIHFVPAVAPAASTKLVEPAAGEQCTYFPGRRYEVRIPGVSLEIPPGQASASAHLAMACSDGKAYVADDPVWSRPGRGGLGGRPGNQSVLSPVVRVHAVQRAQPPAVENVPPAPEEAIFAKPANYYGQARYTLAWESAPGAQGYVVYRCSGAALFDQDRALRQGRKGDYASGSVFADDDGFAVWLAEFDPALTEAEMVDHAQEHLPAWRAWAGQFYAQRTDVQVQELANRQGNQAAFRRLNKEAASTSAYEDMFDGRGQGFYLYRVRVLDAAGNLSEWSETFPPVHIFDVTPPATPAVTSVAGGERYAVLRWRANREKDLGQYWIWRELEAERLADVRRTPPAVIVMPDGEEATVTYVDEGIAGPQTYYYRIAAVDRNGNVSGPTPLLTARVAESIPPKSPVWERAEWVRLDPEGGEHALDDPAAQEFPAAVALTWLADEILAEATVERRSQYEKLWSGIVTLTEAVDASDPEADNARRFIFYDRAAAPALRYSYRIRARDGGGNLNTQAFNVTSVAPAQSPNGGVNGR